MREDIIAALFLGGIALAFSLIAIGLSMLALFS